MENKLISSQLLKNKTSLAKTIKKLFLLVNVLVVMPAMAHQTFMLPNQFNWKEGDQIDVALSSSLSFPDFGSGFTVDRIEVSHTFINGVEIASVKYRKEKSALHALFTASNKGTAVLAISSKKRHGEIAAKNVDTYFEEIEANEETIDAFHKASEGKPMQRSYSKHVKTLMCVDKCSIHDKPSSQPAGLVLEFVPIENKPNQFFLLRNGKPLANHKVTQALTNKKTYFKKTNAEGVFMIEPELSGTLMLGSVVITIPEEVMGTYHSDYTTLTINLSPSQK
tara:strand:+ start:1195 stop:2034 length:840 start_codon:yes stop_codon:yes gene_type:complete